MKEAGGRKDMGMKDGRGQRLGMNDYGRTEAGDERTGGHRGRGMKVQIEDRGKGMK
jgi:hypothetical protein